MKPDALFDTCPHRAYAQDFGGKSHVPIPGTYQLLQPFYNPTKAAAINDAAMQTQKKAA